MGLKNLVCILALGFKVLSLNSESNIPSEIYRSNYAKQNNSLELKFSEANSDFSLKINDYNFDNQADSIAINGKETFSFLRHKFNAQDSVKEVQLFDIADRFLEFFSEERLSFYQIEKRDNYLDLIKKRFLIKEVKTNGEYKLDNFFSEEFKYQNSIGDLIVENYIRYSRLIKEVKKINPEKTFQDLVDN